MIPEIQQASVIADCIKKELKSKNVSSEVSQCAMAFVLVDTAIEENQNIETFMCFLYKIFDGFMKAKLSLNRLEMDREIKQGFDKVISKAVKEKKKLVKIDVKKDKECDKFKKKAKK